MVNANPLGAILQNVVADPAQQIVAYGNWLYGEVNDTVRWLDHDIEVLVEEHLPKSTHQVAMSVIRSAPEIFVCTAVFSGVGVTPALLYWGTRVAKISWPFIKEILNFQFNQQAVGVAAGQALKDLFDSYKNFRPAIGMCASVAAGVSFVFGWVTGDYSLMIRSSIYGVVAQLAFTAVMLDAQASVEVREAASSLPPRERPLDKVSTEVATKPGHADSSAIEGDPSVAAASSSSSSSSNLADVNAERG